MNGSLPAPVANATEPRALFSSIFLLELVHHPTTNTSCHPNISQDIPHLLKTRHLPTLRVVDSTPSPHTSCLPTSKSSISIPSRPAAKPSTHTKQAPAPGKPSIAALSFQHTYLLQEILSLSALHMSYLYTPNPILAYKHRLVVLNTTDN